MANDKDTNGGEITFTDEQQKLIDKRIGEARVKSREQAKADFETALAKEREEAEQATLQANQEWKELAEKRQARILELEPLEDNATKYQEVISKMLEEKLEKLGDTAKQAVEALPGDLDTLEILSWLNANEKLFITDADPNRERGSSTRRRTDSTEDRDTEKGSGLNIRRL